MLNAVVRKRIGGILFTIRAATSQGGPPFGRAATPQDVQLSASRHRRAEQVEETENPSRKAHDTPDQN